jgi:hypothetical protein
MGHYAMLARGWRLLFGVGLLCHPAWLTDKALRLCQGVISRSQASLLLLHSASDLKPSDSVAFTNWNLEGGIVVNLLHCRMNSVCLS